MEKLTVEGGAEDLTKVEGIDTKGISRCLEVRFKRDEIYVSGCAARTRADH